jgi:hypothetical protein
MRKKFLLREKRVIELNNEKRLIKSKLELIEEQRKKIMQKHHDKHAYNDPFAIRK